MTSENTQISFEDAMREIEQIVRTLEEGQSSLADSMQFYERGVQLKKICDTYLTQARAKIEQITSSADGEPTLESIQVETTNSQAN